MPVIDIHHHIVPPFYLELGNFEARNSANARQVLDWTPAKSIEDMDKTGIKAAVTSLSTPGVWFGDVAQARSLARQCNEFAATMERDYPGRFATLATVPMPDIDGTLEEIRYACDTLAAAGVALLTSYQGVWPGDPKFAPVLEELNRRNALAYFHPTIPPVCVGIMPIVRESALEYLFDTARAMASLLYNGTMLRYPNIRFIFTHAGGAMPPLAERVTRMADSDRMVLPKLAQGSMSELKNIYFDVATSTNPVTMAGLLRLVPVDQIMFGSDYPFVASMPYTLDPLRAYGLGAADLAAIEGGNAQRLFPRLAQ